MNFSFRSVFARLFFNVMLAILIFAGCMFILTQTVHSNSDTINNRSIAKKIADQIDPFLVNADAQYKEGHLLKSRNSLVSVKKNFDAIDENLSADIGLYNPSNELVLQTNSTDLPKTLPDSPSWLENSLATAFGNPTSHVQVKTKSGYTVWYKSRLNNPPMLSPFFNLLAGMVLLLVIMTCALWLIARNITNRLDDMNDKMAQLSDGDFSVRVTAQGNDEITDLAYGFNQAAQKIEQLINANSLLLAHASHEFRTPITRMRLQVEMMEMAGDLLDDAQRAKFKKRAAAINHDLTGLNELIESILMVSRLGAGHGLTEVERVDLLQLAEQECRHFSNISLRGESIFVHVQAKLMLHLVRNLVNNAFVHGVPPVMVCVYGCQQEKDVRFIPNEFWHHEPAEAPKPNAPLVFYKKPIPNATAKFAVIAIIDQGGGVPVDKRDDIFNPFVRLKQEKKGSGLGLSLVAQIAEAHGGRIITDTWHGKTRFLLSLPVATSDKRVIPAR